MTAQPAKKQELTVGELRKLIEKLPDDAKVKYTSDDLAQWWGTVAVAQPCVIHTDANGKAYDLNLRQKVSKQVNGVILFTGPVDNGS